MTDAEYPAFRIAQGTSRPYHEKPPVDKYEVAALGVIADLCDRRGVKHELQAIDLEVREELVQTLAAIIKEGTQ